MQNILKVSLFPILVAVVLGFMGVNFAHAEETGASAEANVSVEATLPPKPNPLQIIRANLRENIKEHRTEVLTDLKNATAGAERRGVMQDARDDRAEFRANIKERLQTLMRTHIGWIIHRLNAALNHFDNIVTRIESRIEKLQARGVDTASVEASLLTATGLMATAEIDVQALSDLIDSVTPDSDPATVKAEIRAAIEKTTASVKAAHRALLATAKMLTELVRTSIEVHATSSVEVNN